MYSRSYPKPQNQRIPPNYNGNAFDLAHIEAPKNNASVKNEQLSEKRPHHKDVRPNPFGTLLFRRGGKRIESDDILLAGLIILLLTSGADEELILILGFLFVVGF